MKKYLINLIFPLAATLTFAFTTTSVSAYDYFPACQSGGSVANSSVCQDTSSASSTDPVISVIKGVMEVVSFITGAAAIILIIISGIKFMTSSGNADKLASARGTLINAIIGMVVTVMAQLIIAFVLDKIS